MTTKEFFLTEADDIIFELETFWTVQRDGKDKYINVPFPSKKEFLDKYETGLDDPWEELSDVDILSANEQNKMIAEQKQRISATYDTIKLIRDKFATAQKIE